MKKLLHHEHFLVDQSQQNTEQMIDIKNSLYDIVVVTFSG